MAEPAKLCVNCAHYSLEEPDPMPDPSRKHWCKNGFDLVTGVIAHCPCSQNRSSITPFHDAWGGSNALFDPCGQEGKYFVAAEPLLSLPNAEYAKEFIAASRSILVERK
jgi:hypothetical protein